MSKIEWTDVTWNPFTGCTKVSPGCDNCYMHADVPTAQGDGRKGYEEDGESVQVCGTASTILRDGRSQTCLCELHERHLPPSHEDAHLLAAFS